MTALVEPFPQATLQELIAPLRQAHMRMPLGRVLAISTMIHVGLLGMFAALGVWEMAAYNGFSVAVFVLAQRLLVRGHLGAAAMLGFAEVLLHQLLAVYFIGWASGFQYYILAIAPLELLLGLRSRTVQSLTIGAALTLYVIMTATLRTVDPVYSLEPAVQVILYNLNLITAFALPITFAFLMRRALESTEATIEAAQRRSEALLQRMLPPVILGRLRSGNGALAEAIDDASILFADLVGFTPFAERTPPGEVLVVLDAIFAAFDDLTLARGLEKIKTLGDAYMVASGAPDPRKDHALALTDLALAMMEVLKTHAARVPGGLRMRIGIHSGPMVAGVIGRTKFAYDLWGDTVNTAARMESHGEPGRIHITEATAQRLGNAMVLEERGVIEVKGKGPMRTFWVVARATPSELTTSNLLSPDVDR